eukprot:11351078-Alexandrium_andersonii.AAC.1
MGTPGACAELAQVQAALRQLRAGSGALAWFVRTGMQPLEGRPPDAPRAEPTSIFPLPLPYPRGGRTAA